MTDKERLEEIKEAYRWTIDNSLVPRLSDSDTEWLIQQAERVQDLKIMLKVLGEQNQRYKQALEFYAERDNYQWEVSYRPQQEIDCMVIDDSGHTARKALEGEKHDRTRNAERST